MKKYCCPWNMSVLEMALSRSFSSWRSWRWMERMPIPCLLFSEKSYHSPVMIPPHWWLTPNALSGVQCAGTTYPGTSKSSLLLLMGSHSSATAEGSWQVILRETSKSSSIRLTEDVQLCEWKWQDHLCSPVNNDCVLCFYLMMTSSETKHLWGGYQMQCKRQKFAVSLVTCKAELWLNVWKWPIKLSWMYCFSAFLIQKCFACTVVYNLYSIFDLV